MILHSDTNNCDSDKAPDLRAKSVADAACPLKKKPIGVSISNLVLWNARSSEKEVKVNESLKDSCCEFDFKNNFADEKLSSQRKKHPNKQINKRVKHMVTC